MISPFPSVTETVKTLVGSFFEEFADDLDGQDRFSLFLHQDSTGDALDGCFQVGGLEMDGIFAVLAGGSQEYARQRVDGAFRTGVPFGDLPVFHELSLVDLKSHNVSLPEVHLLFFLFLVTVMIIGGANTVDNLAAGPDDGASPCG